jgi:hypothetical protein
MPEDTPVQHVQQTWQAVFWLKLNDIIFTIQGKRTRRNWILFAAAKKREAVNRGQLRSTPDSFPGCWVKISTSSGKRQTSPKGLEAEADLRLDDTAPKGVGPLSERAVW